MKRTIPGYLTLKPASHIKVYDTPLSYMWFDEYGIFCSVTKKNVAITKDGLEQTFNYIRQNAGENKICWVGDVTNALFPTREARDYAAEETPHLIKALALITNSEISKLVANVFLVLKKPPYPTKMFTNAQEAKAWLRTFNDE